MKSKTLRYFTTILTVWVAIPIFLAIIIPTTVLADDVADKADKFCSKSYSAVAANIKKACLNGYKQGYNRPKDTSNFCFDMAGGSRTGLTDNQRDAIIRSGTYKACKAGKLAGKAQRAEDDKATAATTSSAGKNDCAGVQTFFKFDCSGKNKEQGGDANPIIALLLTGLSWLTGLVALAVVGGIIYGGILYTSAQDNASQTQKGITFIINSVLGLVVWIAAYALINFIVPGGLF